MDVQWWWFHLQYSFFDDYYFGSLISGCLIEGDCLMEVQLHLQIFEQNGFSLWWKCCCCPSRTGKIIFKVGMSLNEFFAHGSYKYCYLWWGFNFVYRGSPLAHVLHPLSSCIALSLVYAYLTWAEKRKEIESFVKSHPYASLLLSECKRTLQHFSTVSLR